MSVDNGREEPALPVITELDVRPGGKGPAYACSQAMIGKKALGHKGSQNGIAQRGDAGPYVLQGTIAWKMPGTGNLDTVVKDEEAYWCTERVVSVHKRIDQQLFKDHRGNFRCVRGSDAPDGFYPVQVAHDEGVTLPIDAGKRSLNNLPFEKGMYGIAPEAGGPDRELRHNPFRVAVNRSAQARLRKPSSVARFMSWSS